MRKRKKEYIETSYSNSFLNRARCKFCFTGPIDSALMKNKVSSKEKIGSQPYRLVVTSYEYLTDPRFWDKYIYNSYNTQTNVSVAYHSGHQVDNLSRVYYCKCGQTRWVTNSQNRLIITNKLSRLKKKVELL